MNLKVLSAITGTAAVMTALLSIYIYNHSPSLGVIDDLAFNERRYGPTNYISLLRPVFIVHTESVDCYDHQDEFTDEKQSLRLTAGGKKTEPHIVF